MKYMPFPIISKKTIHQIIFRYSEQQKIFEACQVISFWIFFMVSNIEVNDGFPNTKSDYVTIGNGHYEAQTGFIDNQLMKPKMNQLYQHSIIFIKSFSFSAQRPESISRFESI